MTVVGEFWKTLAASVTPEGMLAVVSEVQLAKAPFPIVVTESETTNDAIEEHPRKAPFPIEVTESETTNDVIEEHPRKALSPIAVTESGTTNAVNAEHP